MNSVATAIRVKSLPDPYTIPLDQIDVSDPELYRSDRMWSYFARLRREDPVHYCAESPFGAFWSVTKYNDIMHVETHHGVFSSDASLGGVTLRDGNAGLYLPMFIAMDPPKHDEQRKVVSPVVGPENLAKLEATIRERAGKIFDALPRNEVFNWVDRVSIELTTQMLATLFDFPWEERRNLTRWSDMVTSEEAYLTPEAEEQRKAELGQAAGAFIGMWNERVNLNAPRGDLISMLAHGEATRNMSQEEYLGNCFLLLVGGNDTTRNSISGGLLALNQFPDQYRKLLKNPQLVENMVPEIIRYQTPLSHMRRTALADAEIGGKKIKKGDKVVMWYVSGNRDDEVIDRPNDFIIDRPRSRQHLSFGFGVHRCMGNRLAEMQLRIVWEEILKRWPNTMIEVVGKPKRVYSNFIKGYEELPVIIRE